MKKGIITIGLVIITVMASPFLAIGYIKLAAIDQIYSSIEEIPKRETALVLGAAAYPSKLSPILEDRVETAIELYENDKVEKIIMSGGPNEAPAMKNYAVKKGIPSKNILEDPKGLNTQASIENLSEKVNSIIIVTQKYHLPRSLFIAGTKGIEAIGMTADKSEYVGMKAYEKREFLASGKAILDVFFKH